MGHDMMVVMREEERGRVGDGGRARDGQDAIRALARSALGAVYAHSTQYIQHMLGSDDRGGLGRGVQATTATPAALASCCVLASMNKTTSKKKNDNPRISCTLHVGRRGGPDDAQ